MKIQSHATHNTEGDQEPPSRDHQQHQEFLVTTNALKAMMEEVTSRATAETISRYLAAQRQIQGGRQGQNCEVSRPHLQERSHEGKKIVGTNNVPLCNAIRGALLQEDEAGRHGPMHQGVPY